MDAQFLSGKKIVIAGAGMSGLSFALALRKHWPVSLRPPEVTIYERDTELTAAGREGYSLSLAGFDETGGLVVLRDLGLLNTALEHAILGLGDKGAFKLWSSSWSELMSVKYKPFPGLPTSGIRIARKDLRQVLIDAIGPQQIQWGTACISAEVVREGRMSIQLSGEDIPPEESTVECDLLVATDGASSKVRTCLRPDDTLQFAGAVQIGGIAKFPNGIPKPLDENWGLLLSSGKGVCCFLSPCDSTTVVWAASRLSPTLVSGLNHDDPSNMEAFQEECKKIGDMFAEPLPTIVGATPTKDMFCMNAKDKRPFRHDLSAGPVVFIGDSNHAVSPFAGYGANLALKDGWDLARQLCSAKSLAEAVEAYDAISEPRATKILNSSHWRIETGHATGLRYLCLRVLLGLAGFVMQIVGKN